MTRTARGLAAMLIPMAVGCLAPSAHAQLLAYDGFTGGSAADLDGSAGGSGWATTWSFVAGDPTGIAEDGLDYVGLATTAGSAATPFVVASGSAYARSYGPLPPTSIVYVSFLLRLDEGDGEFGGLTFSTGDLTMHVGAPAGSHMLGLEVEGGFVDLTTVPLLAGETNLIVARISRLVMPPVLTYRLYVNPTVGQPQPGFYDAQIWTEGDFPLPTDLELANSTGFTTDEIRVGTTWASVLPSGPSGPDFDGDGEVGPSDLAILLGFWGEAGGDLNGDGTTDGADLAILLGAWG